MPSTKSKNKPTHSWDFDAIGTSWSIETPKNLSDHTKQEITTCIAAFDAAYSRFRDDSLVGQIAKQAGTYVFPEDSIDLVQMYEKLYDATDGAVTPLIGDTLAALGYDKQYSLQPGKPESVEKWESVMHWNGAVVTTKKPLTLDFGAVGKGDLIDKIATILERSDVDSYLIDASGDIRHRGSDTQTIGLENPHDTAYVIGTIPMQNASLCASASNRRRWGDIHHVIDGRSGKPTPDVTATWVITDTTAIADGLATALFFVGGDRLPQFGDFQFVRLFADGKVEHSNNFVGELFI